MDDEATYVRTRQAEKSEACEVHSKPDADVAETVLNLMWMRRYGGKLTVCKSCVVRSGSSELQRLWNCVDGGQEPLAPFNTGDESGWTSDSG